jgi:hypothetical protein
MAEEYQISPDKDGLLYCKCGNNQFTIRQPPGEWDTIAYCTACGAKESIHSG